MVTQRPPACSSTLCPLRAGDSPAEGRVNPGGPVRPLPLGGFVLFPAENPPFSDNALAQRDEPAAGWGTPLPPRPPRRDRGVPYPATTAPRLPSLQNFQKTPNQTFLSSSFYCLLGQPAGMPRSGEGEPGMKALAVFESAPRVRHRASTPPNPTCGRVSPLGGASIHPCQPTHFPEPARETKDDTKFLVTLSFFQKFISKKYPRLPDFLISSLIEAKRLIISHPLSSSPLLYRLAQHRYINPEKSPSMNVNF